MEAFKQHKAFKHSIKVYDGRPLFWISDYDDADCVMDKVRIDGSWAVY